MTVPVRKSETEDGGTLGDAQGKLEAFRAELKSAQDREQYIEAVHILRDKIIPHLTGNNEDGVHREEIAQMKVLLRDCWVKMGAELKEIRTSTTIEGDKMEAYFNFYRSSKSAEELFVRLAGTMCPKSADIWKESLKNQPVLLPFISMTVIDENGNPKKDMGTDSHWYKQNYSISQGLFRNFLNMILLEATGSGLVNFKEVASFVEAKPLFMDHSEILTFRRGLERLFAWDHVSALYVLVPLYEKVILNVSTICGIDTISLLRWKSKRASTQDKTVGKDFMNDGAVRKIWWEDLSEQINFVLFDDYGYKIRHQIAHWEMDYGACNSQTSFLVLYLYLAIAARIKMNPSS